MCRVNPWIRRAVWLLVIYGILHLLISPLPELGATFSGKSALSFFSSVTYALLELLLLILLVFSGVIVDGFRAEINVLDKICVRLC
jgi:hypothetical protein